MHCITEIVLCISDRIFCIRLIILLPRASRNPDYSLETVSTYLINDRLEIVAHGCVGSITAGITDFYRLVGKLDREPSAVIEHILILGYDIPDGDEVLLIVVAYLYSLRTHARRTHDDIHIMSLSLLGNRDI